VRKYVSIAAIAVAALTLGAGASYGTDTDTEASSAAAPAVACTQGSGRRVLALTSDQRLVCFRRFTPMVTRTVGTISGLQADTALIGIDHRPAGGKLYGVGNQGGIYLLDPATARASLVVRMRDTSGNMVVPSGASFGVDFNPAADRLRIVSDNGQNLRVNVDDGSTTQDGRLVDAAGVVAAGIGGAMYTSNDADPNTSTTLFDVDSALDQLSIQSPPNNGSLVPTGKLGVDSTAEIGADIDTDLRNGSTVANTAYLALNVGGTSRFFQADVLTGKLIARGAFPTGTVVIGVSVPPGQ
jgi:hypothetical protein